MVGPSPVGSRFRRMLDGWLWLGARVAKARAYAPEQAAEVRRLHRAAVARLEAATDLRQPGAVPAAAAILREALWLSLRLLSADSGRPAPAPEAPFEHYDDLRRHDGAFAAAAARHLRGEEQARWLLSPRDPLELDEVPAPLLLARLDAADRFARWLLGLAEPATPRRLLAGRVARVGWLAGVATSCVVGLVWLALRPPNVALGKPAEASGYWPGSPPAENLVNGRIEAPWGAATERGKNTWFAVDLLAPHRLERVVIVNRNDRYSRETPPLVLEVSDDGQAWQEVAKLREEGSPGKRWTWRAAGRVARWVRVRRPDKNFALTEIEVYGRPQ